MSAAATLFVSLHNLPTTATSSKPMNFESSLNNLIMEERRPSAEKRQPSEPENDTINPAKQPQGDDLSTSRTAIHLNNSHHFLPPSHATNTVNGRGCIHNTRKLVFSFKNLQVPSAAAPSEPQKIPASDATKIIRRNSLQRQASNTSTTSSCSTSSNSSMAECYINAQVLGQQKASQAYKPNSNNPADATSTLRQNMQEELHKRLLKTNLGGAQGSKQSPEMQAAFAKRLDELLFKTSKSIESYSDLSTLDRRLQSILAAMQKRKARGTEGSTSSAAASCTASKVAAAKRRRSSTPRALVEQQRRTALLNLLGQADMNRVFKVVAEIKLIQLGRKVTEGKPYEPIPMCTRGGCSFSVPCLGDQKAPKVVRDLFFNTAIVPALERTSPDQMATLPWDVLLAQGEARLAAYHAWYKERQATVKAPEGYFHP